MSIKLKQITDNIHETIYLSELESELISTPYFFRLHDIYQSSTVYMTYPANRTKRYEHSVGTMELASDLLYSAFANAENSTRTKLIEHLQRRFFTLYRESFGKENDVTAPYFRKCIDDINLAIQEKELFSMHERDFLNEIEFAVKDAFKTDVLQDHTLERYQIAALFNYVEDDTGISAYNIFLFMCLIQALRITALFHDVGHPPYSHILEGVIKEIYNAAIVQKSGRKNLEKKRSEFLDCVKQFISKDGRTAFKTSMILTQSSLVDAAFHERVGLAMLQSSFNEVISNEILKATKVTGSASTKLIKILYYMAVSEFAMCMLAESDDFFKSFHKLVDGIVDADRLDYVVRDAENSGVRWGKIPYKRVVESVRAFYKKSDATESEGVFLFAFPEKNQQDITDFLVTRYKIFSRINYHHRCIRTSVALQSCIKQIAMDYLNADEDKGEKPMCNEISFLWKALNRSHGNIEKRIIKWNDSWLITTLQKAYIDFCESPKFNKSEYLSLRLDFEEIILNKKWNYALVKRGQDALKLAGRIFEKAEIDKQLLQSIEEREKQIIYNQNRGGNQAASEKIDMKSDSGGNLMSDPTYNALDSLRQISKMYRILDTGDFELFDTTMPLTEEDLENLMDDVLRALKEDRTVVDYKLLKNDGRSKYGLPKHRDVFDEIYLFGASDIEPYPMNVLLNLMPVINTVSLESPCVFVYVVPPDGVEIGELTEEVLEQISAKTGSHLRTRFEQAFPNFFKKEDRQIV